MDDAQAEIMVLGSIRRGATKFEKIRRAAGLEPAELERILDRLDQRGLIRTEEKKGFFGKKIVITTTKKGDARLEEEIGRMQERWGGMVTLYKEGKREKLGQRIEDDKSLFSMMIFFGIIDMMMFSMMFSMIGASMTDYVPADQVPDGMDDAGADGAGADDGGGGGFDFDIGI